jgi:hypothetical protein
MIKSVLVQDCNLVLYDSNNHPVYASGTYHGSGGAPNAVLPCRMVVNTGSFSVIDSANTVLYHKP